MRPRWRLELLGWLRALRGETVVARFRTEKTGALLAYLAYFAGRSHPREALVELFWPAGRAGRNSLSRELSALRRDLEPRGVTPGTVIVADRASVRLDPRAFATDVADFEAALAGAARAREGEERVLELLRAVALYRGDLLPGLYQDWVLAERDRLREAHARALVELAAHFERARDLDRALELARRAVAADPLREESHLALMRAQSAAGEPGAALRQYAELERTLARELGVAPSAAAQALAREIGRRSTGAPAPAPAGTVTFLLAEAEGPPAASAPPERGAGEARDESKDALRALFRRRGGHEAREGPRSFLVAFARPSEALACALEAHAALGPERAARWRVALDAGEAALEGGAYSGPVVERALLVLAAAHPGQVLCSEEAAVLLRAHLPPDASLEDLGTFRLRGAAAPARLFAAVRPGGPERGRQPPRAEPARAPELPRPLTRFFGREEELRRIEDEVAREGRRLLTITGPGGIGKTRLAVEAAARLAPRTHGAAWFVPLADLREPRLIAHAVLGALRVEREAGTGADPVEAVARALGGERALLVLDNLEHLAEGGAPIVRRLLERASGLACLVTSRRRLGIAGEREVPLAPLAAPRGPAGATARRTGATGGDAEAPERLLRFAGVRLLVDRMEAARPDFALTEATAPAVAALCARLEGVPLALELCAARADALSPRELLARLGRRLELAAAAGSEGPERHRTLRAAIDWSYGLLAPELRRLFARLSVFRGGFGVEAVEEVCREPAARERLVRLREWSMVAAAPGEDEVRFRMLEIVREYAEERLPARERAALARRHAAHYLGLAERAARAHEGPEQRAWLDRLAAEHDNLRAALDRAASRAGDAETGLRLGAALGHFWYARGHLAEGRERLSRLLARARGRTAGRAGALRAAGLLARAQGDDAAAGPLLDRSLALFRALGDRPGAARALNEIGLVAFARHDLDRAQASFAETLGIERGLGSRIRVAHAVNNLGMVADQRGDYGAARARYEEALAIYREAGHERGTAYALANLAVSADNCGDRPGARALYEESLARLRALGDRRGAAYALQHLGLLALDEGDLDGARSLVEESLALFRELGERRGAALSLRALGDVARAGGRGAAARSLYEESLAALGEPGDEAEAAACRERLAAIEAHRPRR